MSKLYKAPYFTFYDFGLFYTQKELLRNSLRLWLPYDSKKIRICDLFLVNALSHCVNIVFLLLRKYFYSIIRHYRIKKFYRIKTVKAATNFQSRINRLKLLPVESSLSVPNHGVHLELLQSFSSQPPFFSITETAAVIPLVIKSS